MNAIFICFLLLSSTTLSVQINVNVTKYVVKGQNFLVSVTVSHEATFEQRFGTDRITIWSALKLVTSRVSKALFRTVDPVCGASRINFEQPVSLCISAIFSGVFVFVIQSSVIIS